MRIFKKIGLDKTDFIISLFTVTGFLLFIPVFTYFYFARDLKDSETLMNRNNTGVVLQDRDGKTFFNLYGAQKKSYVSLSKVPQDFQDAVIAAEDEDFYYHPGFSVKAIARSILFNFKEKGITQGGSTITQQLIKNSLLTPKRDFLRKYQELILAQEIERKFNKREILEMYINSVYFGKGAFGIEQAADAYFGKKTVDLTLAESAYIAGLIPAPSKYSQPSQNMGKSRQNYVLERMLEEKYITSEEKKKAESEKLTFNEIEDEINNHAPHFAMMVREWLEEKYGEEKVSRSGFVVKTTLDLEWQKYAEVIVREQTNKLAMNSVSNGAALALDPKTGEVLVVVGSRDWQNDQYGKFNIATALRQPGSSFKPLIYSLAMEKGLITAATPLKDEPIKYEMWGQIYEPKNYDGKFRGQVLARRALANSLNVPAVEVMNKLGVEEVVSNIGRFGISTINDPKNYGLSLVLGSGEVKLIDLVSAYSVFANQGSRVEPSIILEIKDKMGNVIYGHTEKSEQVISAENAYLISSILSDKGARSETFGKALDVSRIAAVKTGTTQNYKDGWTLGYTPNIVVGVWVGNNDGRPMDRIAGSLGAAPIWRQLMEKFFQKLEVAQFQKPDGIIALSICKGAGLVANGGDSYSEYFVQGTQPKTKCPAPPTPAPEDLAQNPEPSPQPDQQPVGGPPTDLQIQVANKPEKEESGQDKKED